MKRPIIFAIDDLLFEPFLVTWMPSSNMLVIIVTLLHQLLIFESHLNLWLIDFEICIFSVN